MSRLFAFVGGSLGSWKVARFESLVGPPLEQVDRLEIVPGPSAATLPDADGCCEGS